ncbi:ANM_collapsed_G0037490.mRNA.1.CDS.1 [Saccharomyces cerevisiae]|nr:ANM_collapsed_G0037490.mRNA.1.CDS.1 [Saccharomyces cerevisiae]
MKLFQNSYDFNYPWDQVTAANWKKYPNEISTHVIAVDVLRRELKDQGKVLVTERLITVKQGVPKWIMMMLGGTNMSHVREVSVVDLNKKSLTMRSCNLTMCNLLKVYETVTYSPHPDDSANKTLFSRKPKLQHMDPLESCVIRWKIGQFKGFARTLKRVKWDSMLFCKYLVKIGKNMLMT